MLSQQRRGYAVPFVPSLSVGCIERGFCLTLPPRVRPQSHEKLLGAGNNNEECALPSSRRCASITTDSRMESRNCTSYHVNNDRHCILKLWIGFDNSDGKGKNRYLVEEQNDI